MMCIVCTAYIMWPKLAYTEVFPDQFLYKSEAGGVACKEGTERLIWVPQFWSMTMYLSLALLGSLMPKCPLGPPHPMKNPSHPTHGGVTTTGPDATHPPTIFQNWGGGGGGGGGGGAVGGV